MAGDLSRVQKIYGSIVLAQIVYFYSTNYNEKKRTRC